MARWTHLFPSRTQKLSTVAVKVALGKNNKLPGSFFCLFLFKFIFDIIKLLIYIRLCGW